MRSEQEMLDLILDTARRDDRIRAVIMNGSRANPNAPRDMFQDFDVVLYQSETYSNWPKGNLVSIMPSYDS